MSLFSLKCLLKQVSSKDGVKKMIGIVKWAIKSAKIAPSTMAGFVPLSGYIELASEKLPPKGK